ncbi:MAG TPA: acyl-CoA dehydrogenase family protein, partial [Thermoanaerobaculia bacterium]|nr:acyl-CoA dehydrogenase family protein [Thermoanaerobaculia bacterium]
MTLNHESPWMNDDLRMFRGTVRQFIDKEFVPQQACWRKQLRPPAEAWLGAGRVGMLLPDLPEEYGGGGGNFAHQAVVLEELARGGVHFGCNIQSAVARYILAYGSEEQKQGWLPRMARGELVGAVAMSEPGAGSDLQGIRTTAVRDGDSYVINGSKTFVTNGWHAGIVCLAVKTNPKVSGFRGISLLMIEPKDLPGFSIGRSLEKVGMHAQDTCELFFEDVRVPATSLLGAAEGKGLPQMMEQLPYERLTIGVSAVATTEQAVFVTTRYVKERMAFGNALIDFQNTRFKLAECKTESRIGRVFLDDCIQEFIAGRLDDTATAMAKYWLTDRECRIVDDCLQLHGGYGYMTEYPIAHMWADSRV